MPDDKRSLQTECKSSEALVRYLEEKAQNHRHFKMYTTLEGLKYKMEQESIFLSAGANWNDKSDSNHFNPAGCGIKNFGACFSFSQSESVAMWMLYGGMQKTGAMVDYRKENVLSCFDAETVTFGIWENGTFTPTIDLDRTKFQFRLIDILYKGDSKKGSDYYYIRRSSETHHVPRGILENTKCFIKAMPWNYENECRLVLSIDAKYLPNSKINSVKITIPGIYDSLEGEKRIFAAPNFSEHPNELQESTLCADIDWDLCYKCNSRSQSEEQTHQQQETQQRNKIAAM